MTTNTAWVMTLIGLFDTTGPVIGLYDSKEDAQAVQRACHDGQSWLITGPWEPHYIQPGVWEANCEDAFYRVCIQEHRIVSQHEDRAREFMRQCATQYQHRANEAREAIDWLKGSESDADPVIELLTHNADLWQRLADGARGAANGRGR